MADRVPFTILTGFLGAGKTTVLNRMLSAPRGRRIAVLVNELGRIAIDSKLIIGGGGDVLELAGGCVCCKVDIKSDLWDGIGEVIRRSNPDHVVLETTGIAEPSAIIEGFERIPAAERGRVVVAGTVCVVDADAGVAQLERRGEAREQILAADRLMLSKLDLAGAADVDALHECLRGLNPAAEVAAFPDDATGTGALTHWILEVRAQRSRAHRHSHRHGDGQVTAVVFQDETPVVASRVLEVLAGLGSALLRAKGFVHLAGESERAYIEHAGRHTTVKLVGPWPEGTPSATELVVIGEDLDEAAVMRALWACRAGR